MTLKPILAALLTVAALPAAAQTAPAAGTPPMAMRHHDPAMMQEMMQKMRQRHADDMALLLDLKPAQRPALDAFLASHHAMGEGGMGEGGMDHHPEGAPGTHPAAPSFAERLDRMDQLATGRAEAEHKRIAAAKAFYQSLDPHQRQLFEAVMRLRHGGGHGGMGGMGGGMHGGHPGGSGPMGGHEAPQD